MKKKILFAISIIALGLWISSLVFSDVTYEKIKESDNLFVKETGRKSCDEVTKVYIKEEGDITYVSIFCTHTGGILDSYFVINGYKEGMSTYTERINKPSFDTGTTYENYTEMMNRYTDEDLSNTWTNLTFTRTIRYLSFIIAAISIPYTISLHKKGY